MPLISREKSSLKGRWRLETVQDMKSSSSNPVSCAETPIKIYGSKEEIRARKSPETVDAPGFAPDASIPVILYGAAGQIRTADLILTKKFAFILPCVRLCLYIPSGLCAIRIFVLSSLSSFYLILGRLLEDLLEILFRILHQNRIPYGVLLQSRPTHLPNTHTSVK